MMGYSSFDYIVLGAGIIGLSIAKEILDDNRNSSILVIDKENEIGKHASGRNSGVLHSGIYYQSKTLKAELCRAGAKSLYEYCMSYDLPIKKIGKMIVASSEEDFNVLDELYNRGINNLINVEKIDQKQILEKEPNIAKSCVRALYLPDVSVIDPIEVLNHIYQNLVESGVKFIFNAEFEDVDQRSSTVILKNNKYKFGYFINSTGLFADKIARKLDLAKSYTILPIRGKYFKLKEWNDKINGLIYPTPNIDMPFLGIHVTKSVNSDIYVGPSAMPALGRENYRGFKKASARDMVNIFSFFPEMFIRDKKGFRKYAVSEIKNLSKKYFADKVSQLICGVDKNELIDSGKVGIRAQLFDIRKKEFVMDFVVEKKSNTLNILNAVSPALTSSFAFSGYVFNNYIKEGFSQ